MSLSKIQTPLDLSPVNNPIPIVYGSSFADQSGFRYKLELLDSDDNVETELWVYPDTDNSNYCIYDFSMILGDLIDSNKETWDATGYTESYESLLNFNYTITEYIGSTSGDTDIGDGYYTFRGVKQYGDKWITSEYMTIDDTSKFLSNKISREYKLDEYATVNTFFGVFGSSDTSNFDRVIIDIYNGDYLRRFNYINTITTGHAPTIMTLPIGPIQLNIMANAGSIYTGSTSGTIATGDIILDDTVYYDIHTQSKTDITSESIRIYVDHNCYKHDGVEFLWLGDLSTYETYSARYADLKSFKTSRNEVKSNHYDLDSGQYDYQIGNRGRKNINIRTTESHIVYTDWIKDDVASDLMELFRSPDVYIIKDDEIYPIIITDTGYVEKTVRNNRLFNYKISYQMAYEKYSNI